MRVKNSYPPYKTPSDPCEGVEIKLTAEEKSALDRSAELVREPVLRVQA